MSNPNVRLDPWLWRQPTIFGPKPRPGSENLKGIQSLNMPNLSKFPDFIRDPESHVFEMQSSYARMLVECAQMKKLLAMFPKPVSPCFSHVIGLQYPTQQLHSRYQVVYGMLLTLAMMLNTILRAFDPDDVILIQESVTLPVDIITLARYAVPYRPLGASYIPLCLVAAWAATDNPLERVEVEVMLAEYQTDFASANWMEMARWLHGQHEALRFRLATAALLSASPDGCYSVPSATSSPSETTMSPGGSCRVM
jgi:hypothetical protein